MSALQIGPARTPTAYPTAMIARNITMEVYDQRENVVDEESLPFENANYFFAFRCGHPGQQHGRRFPSSNCSTIRSTCSARVSAFFTIVVQQIHSLRARGVRSFHRSSASGSACSAARISAGTTWTTPVAMVFFCMGEKPVIESMIRRSSTKTKEEPDSTTDDATLHP